MKVKTSVKFVGLFAIAAIVGTVSRGFSTAPDPCNGSCVRKVVDCKPRGSKCSDTGTQCGVEQECKGTDGQS